MKRGLRTRWARRIASTAAVGTAVSLVSLSLASPAQARPAAGWYMLVNDYYDGGSGYDGGQMWCLSTNTQTSQAGSNTHYVFLDECDPGTRAQWWYLNDVGATTVMNYQYLGGTAWELSANATGAYTAAASYAETHYWYINGAGGTNRYWIDNAALSNTELSASHNNPVIPGTMNVYTAGFNGAPAHVWRYWQPEGRPR